MPQGESMTTYRIRTISELVGIPRPTLVAWERRYDLLGPAQSKDGIRYYSEQDLQTFLQVKQLIDSGVRISEAVEKVKSNR